MDEITQIYLKVTFDNGRSKYLYIDPEDVSDEMLNEIEDLMMNYIERKRRSR